MALKAITGKVAWVDLARKEVTVEAPDEKIYLDYLGGYGLGAYYLFRRQPPKTDPLGPDAVLGFTTGPLTGTDAITGNRFAVVGKSPKTGGWGDANCGGRFGPALKQAGLDAVFFTGISPAPVYALVEGGKLVLRDAADYWGLGCVAAEEKFKAEFGSKTQSAVIGPAGERRSALACIINDRGRAAGRSGLGKVMGAKQLKALVAVPEGGVDVADPEGLKNFRRELLNEYYQKGNPFYDFFHNLGTPGVLPGGVYSQDTPIKNWGGTPDDCPGHEAIGGGEVLKLQKKPYGCWKCPIACGGHVEVESGPYAGQGHKPEYETLAAFGTMCLNHDLGSIVRANNICNDGGIDTISAGATVAFAIECYENGVIDKSDTGGLELSWGNHEAIVRLTEQLVSGEGFGGQILGDGVRAAVEKLGPDAAPFAMECGGEELPMHDPRCTPGYAASYVFDATPGRHTQMGAASVEGGFVPPGFPAPAVEDKYTYSGKGEVQKVTASFSHAMNSAGLCLFASVITPADALPKYLTLAMGREFSMEEVLTAGERIASLRIAFNLREGVVNKDTYKMPGRALGRPPLKNGPVANVTIDNDAQLKDFYEAMGWDPETGIPRRATLERLGLGFAAEGAD